MTATVAFIGLGSNLAHPRRQIARAIAALARLPGCRLLRRRTGRNRGHCRRDGEAHDQAEGTRCEDHRTILPQARVPVRTACAQAARSRNKKAGSHDGNRLR